MKLLIIAAALVLPSLAFAGSPDHNTVAGGGTYAGQTPRGQSVANHNDIYHADDTNRGQAWAKPRTEEAHGQPGPGSEVANDIQGHLAQDDPAQGPQIVGNGRIK